MHGWTCCCLDRALPGRCPPSQAFTGCAGLQATRTHPHLHATSLGPVAPPLPLFPIPRPHVPVPQLTGVAEEDILYVNYENRLGGLLPYFIALDRPRKVRCGCPTCCCPQRQQRLSQQYLRQQGLAAGVTCGCTTAFGCSTCGHCTAVFLGSGRPHVASSVVVVRAAWVRESQGPKGRRCARPATAEHGAHTALRRCGASTLTHVCMWAVGRGVAHHPEPNHDSSGAVHAWPRPPAALCPSSCAPRPAPPTHPALRLWCSPSAAP